MTNYLPDQYKTDNALSINHNYFKEQFEDHKEIFAEIDSNFKGTSNLDMLKLMTKFSN